MTAETQTCFVKTIIGTIRIIGDRDGISDIRIVDNTEVSSDVPADLKNCALQLAEYLAGDRTVFDLNLQQPGTAFQQKVWRELTKIPFGSTISYLDLAKKLGDPKAVRAVASANAKNKLWIVVPCHRVIGSDGSLTGYAGGLTVKKWLLKHENVGGQPELF